MNMAIGGPPKSSKPGGGGRFASIGGVLINSYGMALEALRAAETYFSSRSGGEQKVEQEPSQKEEKTDGDGG
jgi:hypothetical protein